MSDRINELQKVRDILTKVDYNTLSEILDSYVPRIPMAIIDFKNDKFDLSQHYAGGSNLLYRARIIDEKTKKPFKFLQDLSFIPDNKRHKIKSYGRVNKPGESMFYASTDLSTACVETFSKGDNMARFLEKNSILLAVGVWKIEKPMSFIQMTSPEKYFEGFLEKAKTLELKKVTLETIAKQNENLRKKINNDEEFKILEFFSEEFAKIRIDDHREYMLSNYFADIVFNRSKKFKIPQQIDGIWYPSVPSSYQETNVVLPPDVVEKKLKFLWADIVWVVHFPKNGQTQFNPIKKGAKVNEQGIIEWNSKEVG